MTFILVWSFFVFVVNGDSVFRETSPMSTSMSCKDPECCEFSKGRHPSPKRVNQNCYTGRGHDFRGKQNTSRDGRICMNWRQRGGEYWGEKTRRTRYGIGDHNYCRNPDPNDSGGPWCYVDYDLFSRCGITTCKDYNDASPEPITRDQNNTELSELFPDLMYSFNDEVFYITANYNKKTYQVYKFSDVNMTSVGEPPSQDIKYAFNLCVSSIAHDVMSFATSHDDKLFLYFEIPDVMIEITFTSQVPSWTIVNKDVYATCLSEGKSTLESGTLSRVRQVFSMKEPHVVFLLLGNQMIRCEWRDDNLDFINSTEFPYDFRPGRNLYFKDQQGTYFQLRNPSPSRRHPDVETTEAVDRYPALAHPLLGYDYLNKKSLVKLRTGNESCALDGERSRIYQLYDGDHLDDIIRWLRRRKGWLRVHNINIRKSSFCDSVENVSCCRDTIHQILASETNVNYINEHDDTCNNENFFIYCNAYFPGEETKCPQVSCHYDKTEIKTEDAVVCEIQMEKDPPCSISLRKILNDFESDEITYENVDVAFQKIDAVAASINYQDRNSTKVLATLIGSVHALENVNYASLSRSRTEEMISNVFDIVDNIVDDDRVDVWISLQKEEQAITTNNTSAMKVKTVSPTDMLFRMENILGEIVSAQQANEDLSDNSKLAMTFRTKNAISVIQQLGEGGKDFDGEALADKSFLKFDCASTKENNTIAIVSKYPQFMRLISRVENAKSDCRAGKCDSETSSIEYVKSSPVISASVLKLGKKISSGVTFIIPYTFDDIPDPKQRHSKFYFSCRYLAETDNSDKNQWDESGCKVSKVDHKKKLVYCSCNHTTNFAVLLQVVPPKIKKEDMVNLQVISYIGESISVFCLLITLSTFTVFRSSLKSPRMVAHLHLVVALLLFHSTQLLVTFAEKEKNSTSVACVIVTFLTHFSLLASFCWMLVEGMLLHISVISVFYSIKCMEVFRYVLGWVFPGIISGVTILYGLTRLPYPTCYLEGVGEMSCPDESDDLFSNSDSQPRTQLVEWCWLSTSNYIVLAMAAPAIVAILTNTVILVRVSWVIAQTSKATNMYRPTTEQKKDKHIRKCIKGAIILMPILGIPWIFGFIPQAASHVAFLYIFAVLNSLQGFFIMLFYCILSSEVKSAYNKYVHTRNVMHSQQNWSTHSSGRHPFGDFKSGSRLPNTSATELIKTDSKTSSKRKLFSSKHENFLLRDSSNNNVTKATLHHESRL